MRCEQSDYSITLWLSETRAMFSKARYVNKKLAVALKDPHERPWQALAHTQYEMAYL